MSPQEPTVNCATCARSPGSETPGDPGTSEPSTTHRCESSRAPKSRDSRPSGRSAENGVKTS